MTTPDERLTAAIGAAGSPVGSFEALGAAARAELQRAPKARPWWVDGLILLGLNLVMGVGAALAMSWSNTQHGNATLTWVVAAGWLLVMTLGSLWWLRPGNETGRWAVMGLTLLVFALSLGSLSGFDTGRPFMAGMSCAFIECGLALAPAAVALLFSSRFAARPGHLVVAALAASAGGALALHFHCANGTVAHVFSFHLLPAVLLAALAVLIRRRVKSRAFVP